MALVILPVLWPHHMEGMTTLMDKFIQWIMDLEVVCGVTEEAIQDRPDLVVCIPDIEGLRMAVSYLV